MVYHLPFWFLVHYLRKMGDNMATYHAHKGMGPSNPTKSGQLGGPFRSTVLSKSCLWHPPEWLLSRCWKYFNSWRERSGLVFPHCIKNVLYYMYNILISSIWPIIWPCRRVSIPVHNTAIQILYYIKGHILVLLL